MPRADIRTQAGSDFGKDGVTFPWGDLAYPRIVMTMSPRQNQPFKEFLSAYDGADAANWTSTKLVSVSSPTPGDNQQNNVRYAWERLPGVELIRKGYDVETGAPTRVVRQRVALPTAPTALGNARTFDTIAMFAQDSYVEPESEVVGTLVTVYQQLPTTILTVYSQDEETGVVVSTAYQVVAMPVSPPTPTPGILISFQKIDSQKALKITRDFTGFLSYTITEQRFSADTFPALFDYTLYTWLDQCGAFSNIRGSFSAKVQTQVAISYSTAVVPVAGLTLIPKTLQLGRGVQISSQVLVDTGSYTYSGGSCSATVSWVGSTPDFTTYTSSIMNTQQVVAGESTLFKAGLFKTLTVSQLML